MNKKTKSVQSALDVLRRVPAPEPEAWEAAKEAYLSEVRTLAAEAETTEPSVGRRGWMAGLRMWIESRIGEDKMQLVYKVVIALMVVLGGSAGTVRASQESLPGSLLYPVKLQWEQWRLDATRDASQEAVQAMAMAQTRMDEIERLREHEKAVPQAVLVRYRDQIGRALAASEELDDEQRERVQAQIAAMIEANLREAQQLSAGDDGGESGTLREMIRVMDEIRRQLRAQQDDGDMMDDDDSPGLLDEDGSILGDDDDMPGDDDDEDTPGDDDDMPGADDDDDDMPSDDDDEDDVPGDDGDDDDMPGDDGDDDMPGDDGDDDDMPGHDDDEDDVPGDDDDDDDMSDDDDDDDDVPGDDGEDDDDDD